MEPICLFDGGRDPGIISWLEKNSVKVIRAQVPFREELYSHKTIEANKGTPYDPDHAAGAFLRLVSPDYVKDSHFIYTDCDVMFVNDPSCFYKFPQYIAACGETIVNGDVTDAQSAFNSGVMIINREGFLSRRDELIAVIRSNNFYLKQHQSYDQTMINMVFRGEWGDFGRRIKLETVSRN